jgi:hypothetical protein
MATINHLWHKQHPLPKPATPGQMRQWHEAHQKECGCRPMPEMPPSKPAVKKPPQPLDTLLDCD